MQKTLMALSLAAGCGLVLSSSAGAVPTATAMRPSAAMSVQLVQYAQHRTRHGVVKCYRDFVIGPYRCHHFRNWL